MGYISFQYRNLNSVNVLFLAANSVSKTTFGIVIMNSTTGNLIQNWSFQELNPYSTNITILGVYVEDQFNFRSIGCDSGQDIIVMIMNTTKGSINYKRVMINVSSISIIRFARFVSSMEYLIAGSGSRIITDYNSLIEIQYPTQWAN